MIEDRQFSSLAPITFFTGFCLVSNPIIISILDKTDFVPFFAMIFVGWFIAQTSLLTLIGGLGGRHWITGFVLANILLAVGTTFVLFATEPRIERRDITFLWCLPGGLLLSILHLLAVRLIQRRRISIFGKPALPIRIEDYLITIAVVASCIALFRAHLVAVAVDSTNFRFTNSYREGMVGFLVINLISLPAIFLAFRPVPFVLRLIYAAVYSCVVWFAYLVLLVVVNGLSGSSGPVEAEILFYPFIILATASFGITTGIQLMRLSGFELQSKRSDRLQYYPLPDPDFQKSPDTSPLQSIRSAEPVIDPFSEEAESLAGVRATRKHDSLDPSQKLARWLTLGLIGYAIIANL